MTTFIRPFRVGDVVLYAGRDRVWRSCTTQKHIINEVKINGINSYEYSTNIGAWIPHNQFRLLEECSEKSIKQLIKDIQAEANDY